MEQQAPNTAEQPNTDEELMDDADMQEQIRRMNELLQEFSQGNEALQQQMGQIDAMRAAFLQEFGIEDGELPDDANSK